MHIAVKLLACQAQSITLCKNLRTKIMKCCVVQLIDIIAVWLMDIVSFFLFCNIVLCTACKSQAYFVMLSPRLSVTDTICLHFNFSVSITSMEGIVSCLFLFIRGHAKCLSRKQCVGFECKSRHLVLLIQSAEVYRTVTSSFVWSCTISANVNEGIQDPANWTQYSSFVSALFTVYA
jgi:hypothetical protein